MLTGLLASLSAYAEDAGIPLPSSMRSPSQDGPMTDTECDCPDANTTAEGTPVFVDTKGQHLPGTSGFPDPINRGSGRTQVRIPEEYPEGTASTTEEAPIELTDDEALEAHITAASVTSIPGSIRSQNPLFSSSTEIYADAAARMPGALSPLSVSDALESINTVITKSRLNTVPPGHRFGNSSDTVPPLPSIHGNQESHTPPLPKCSKVEGSEFKTLQAIIQNVFHYHARIHNDIPKLSSSDQRILLDEISLYLRQRMKLVRTLEIRETERSRKRDSKQQLSRIGEQLKEEREKAKRLILNLEMKVTELYAPLLTSSQSPVEVKCDDLYLTGLDQHHGINQVLCVLAVVCNLVMGLSIVQANFILSTAAMLVRLAMSCGVPRDEDDQPLLNGLQDEVIRNMPRSLHEALGSFDINGTLHLYATCPTCSATHAPSAFDGTDFPVFPENCKNEIVGETGTHVCGAHLLYQRHDGTLQPIKPYLVGSLTDHLARCLADPIYVQQSTSAADHANARINKKEAPSKVRNVFEASFMEEFLGPDGRLFVKRGNQIRLAFALHLDFCNPNGNRRGGNHDSIGIISAANLALDPSIRYLPEYMFFAGVIPGAREPSFDELDYFLQPVIRQFQQAWRPGIRLSRIAGSPHGAIVEVAIVLSVNDLPAARKLAGLQGHNCGNFICSVCKLVGKDQIFSTDRDRWVPRNRYHLRKWAHAWKKARTSQEREDIFETHGVRWSSMWELEYWDPTRMLVIDSMHCILEGLVQFHCRNVLLLDPSAHKLTTDGFRHAFDWPWVPYDRSIAPLGCRVNGEHVPRIAKIQETLCLALEGDRSLTLNEIWTRLENVGTKPALCFVAWSLGIFPGNLKVREEILSLYTVRAVQKSRAKDRTKVDIQSPQGRPLKSKNHCIAALLNWRLDRDLRSNARAIPTSSPETLQHVQQVIKATLTPSWVNSVPRNYGEAGAGVLKADEWRTLSTIYLPIALITLWGDIDGCKPLDDDSDEGLLAKALEHTMALFQATTLACRYTTTLSGITSYRQHLAKWTGELRKLYPHLYETVPRPNIHAAAHISDFLVLFGPVLSWWCFPFERLIGTLQKVNTNGRIGGMLESTIMRSQTRVANIRRWLRRPNCPECIKELKKIFDKCFVPTNTTEEVIEIKKLHRSYVKYDGVHFSPAATHEGNANIIYRPTPDGEPIAGQIIHTENIRTAAGVVVRLYVRQHLPLPETLYDPFQHYPDFPAKTYSTRTSLLVDEIGLESIVAHAARYDFSHERSVFCNLSRE